MQHALRFKPAFFAFFLIAAAVTLIYAQTLRFDFIHFDDTEYISGNPHIQNGLTVQGIKWAFTADLLFDSPHADYWQPATFISRMLDISIFGLHPGGHHAMNAALHFMNAWLLFYLFYRISGGFWKCLMLALFFTVHPLQAEPVSWITARKDLLSAFFGLLAMCAYLRQRRDPSFAAWIPVYLFFILGLMSKPVLAVLPVLLLILDMLPTGRIHSRNCTEKTPLFLIGFIFALNPIIGPARAAGYGNYWEVIYQALISYPYHLWKAVYPAPLGIASPDEARVMIPVFAGAAVVFLLAVTAALFRNVRRFPFLFGGWAWFLAALFPSTLIHTPADRFMYLPLAGLGIMFAWGLDDLTVKLPKTKKPVFALAITLLVAFGVLSFRQANHWKDSRSIFSHSARVLKNNFAAVNNLGNVFYRDGKWDEAIEQYRAAVQINPYNPKPYFNMANALYKQGKTNEAVSYYQKAVELDPNYAKAHYNLANVYSQTGRKELAVAHFKEAIRSRPDFPEARQNLAADLADLGRPEEAGKLQEILAESRPR